MSDIFAAQKIPPENEFPRTLKPAFSASRWRDKCRLFGKRQLGLAAVSAIDPAGRVQKPADQPEQRGLARAVCGR